MVQNIFLPGQPVSLISRGIVTLKNMNRTKQLSNPSSRSRGHNLPYAHRLISKLA